VLGVDETLFRLLYESAGPVTVTVATAVTHLGTRGGMWTALAILLCLFGRGLARRVGLAVGLALVGNVTLNELLLKRLVARPRPWKTLGVPLRDGIVNPESFSFPSGHAVAAFACAVILGAWLPRWRWAWLSLAALIALSRVQLGAHYPLDVTVGAVLGGGLGWGLARALRIGPRDTPAPPPA
jgi:undecaprenyl-diphosphatase